MSANDTGGHNGEQQPKLPPALQCVHDAMMEELGVQRRNALPLADRGPNVSSTAFVPRPSSLTPNSWTSYVPDDVDPAMVASDIAGGQLYRIRRGPGYYSQGQPSGTRGGGQHGSRGASTNSPSSSRGEGRGGRGGRGGSGRGGYSNARNDRARGNIGSRHMNAILMMRDIPSDKPTRGRTIARGGRSGDRGNSRGASQSTGGRRREIPHQRTIELSNERFMASVVAQQRVPSTQTAPSTDVKGSGLGGSRFADDNMAKTQFVPPHLRGLGPVSVATQPTAVIGSPEPLKSAKTQTGGLSSSRWNHDSEVPSPAQAPSDVGRVLEDISNVYNGPRHISQNSPPPVNQVSPANTVAKFFFGYRLRAAGQSQSEVADFRLCKDDGTGDFRLQGMKHKDATSGIMSINDVITSKTTLDVKPDSTIVVYCSHALPNSTVWEIIVSLPHEGVSFVRSCLPRGSQNHHCPSREAVREGGSSQGPSYHANPDLDEAERNDSLTAEPVRSIMMDMSLFGAEVIDAIFETIDDVNKGGPFLERVLALAELNAQSTAIEIYESQKVADATAQVTLEFFDGSELWRVLTVAEQKAYIDHVAPLLLNLAVESREPANASAHAYELDASPSAKVQGILETAEKIGGPSKKTIYSIGEILELRGQGAPSPSLKFAPTKEKHLSKVDRRPSTAPAAGTVQKPSSASRPVSDGVANSVMSQLDIMSVDLKDSKVSWEVPADLGSPIPNGALAEFSKSVEVDYSTPLCSTAFIQEEPSADMIAEMEVRKTIGLVNLSKSMFYDESMYPVPSSERDVSVLATPAVPETFKPMTQGAVPTVVPAPVIMKEKSSAMVLAESEARKMRGATALANSRWAEFPVVAPLLPKRQGRQHN